MKHTTISLFKRQYLEKTSNNILDAIIIFRVIMITSYTT